MPLSALFDPDVTDSVLQEAYTATFKSIKITETQAKNLAESTKEQAESTKEQAESDIWMEHRKGRITASTKQLLSLSAFNKNNNKITIIIVALIMCSD